MATARPLAFVGSTGTVEASFTVPLLGGQTIEAGSLVLSATDENLLVTYCLSAGWVLDEVHLSIGQGLSSIPTNNGGNPVIGGFPYAASSRSSATEYTFTIPLSVIGAVAGLEYTVAAHASMHKVLSDGTVQSETAWAKGNRVNAKRGGSWATYFTFLFGEPATPVAEETAETAFPTKNGAYTVAPGQYPVNVVLAKGDFETSFSGLEDGFYIIAHAVVWGQFD